MDDKPIHVVVEGAVEKELGLIGAIITKALLDHGFSQACFITPTTILEEMILEAPSEECEHSLSNRCAVFKKKILVMTCSATEAQLSENWRHVVKRLFGMSLEKATA